MSEGKMRAHVSKDVVPRTLRTVEAVPENARVWQPSALSQDDWRFPENVPSLAIVIVVVVDPTRAAPKAAQPGSSVVHVAIPVNDPVPTGTPFANAALANVAQSAIARARAKLLVFVISSR
jgi:hypothetical protein